MPERLLLRELVSDVAAWGLVVREDGAVAKDDVERLVALCGLPNDWPGSAYVIWDMRQEMVFQFCCNL